MPTYLAVIGPSQAEQPVLEAATEVGVLIARAGAILVCGGGGGAMQAACQGARSARGLTLGILGEADRDGANPFVDVSIPTGMGEARNALVVRTAQAVIAMGGGLGTLSEIGLALKMQRPVVGLWTWEAALPGGGGEALPILRAITAREAVSCALAAIARGD